MSARSNWKAFGWKPYICPSCKRDKGMLYLDGEGRLRYICFCGVNMKIDSIQQEYDFTKKGFVNVAESEGGSE